MRRQVNMDQHNKLHYDKNLPQQYILGFLFFLRKKEATSPLLLRLTAEHVGAKRVTDIWLTRSGRQQRSTGSVVL